MKTKRLEVKEGNISVPIYEFFDGRYCVDALLGEKRKRITRTSLDAAKIEARKLIAQIASGRAHEEPMTLAEGKLVPFDVSLLSAVEEWIAGRGKTPRIITKTVAEVAEEFLISKRVEGVGFFHLEDRKYRMNKFAASFPAGLIKSALTKSRSG